MRPDGAALPCVTEDAPGAIASTSWIPAIAQLDVSVCCDSAPHRRVALLLRTCNPDLHVTCTRQNASFTTQLQARHEVRNPGLLSADCPRRASASAGLPFSSVHLVSMHIPVAGGR
jgi:hypothetical protein